MLLVGSKLNMEGEMQDTKTAAELIQEAIEHMVEVYGISRHDANRRLVKYLAQEAEKEAKQ